MSRSDGDIGRDAPDAAVFEACIRASSDRILTAEPEIATHIVCQVGQADLHPCPGDADRADVQPHVALLVSIKHELS